MGKLWRKFKEQYIGFTRQYQKTLQDLMRDVRIIKNLRDIGWNRLKYQRKNTLKKKHWRTMRVKKGKSKEKSGKFDTNLSETWGKFERILT